MPAASVEEIRSQMARIRMRAHRKAEKLGEDTRHFLDWKHYVRLFPWAAVGLAAAVGYWIVPKRSSRRFPESQLADSRLLEALGKKNSVVVAPVPVAAATMQRSGLLGQLGSALKSALFKAGMAYASQYLAQAIAAGTSQRPVPPMGAAPPSTPQRRTPHGTFGTGDEPRPHASAAPRTW